MEIGKIQMEKKQQKQGEEEEEDDDDVAVGLGNVFDVTAKLFHHPNSLFSGQPHSRSVFLRVHDNLIHTFSMISSLPA